MYIFLALNGQDFEPEETEVVELMVAIADGQRSESEVVAWLRQHTT
jgi:prophage maintenance system killer protein